ncbi:hypothetical protein PABY_19380 [Pyrodictium abyssi]|uniref:Glycosyltransferase 2-like domain-containing protein n=1 Tax=Pyrodictium abyssi TaxID=54256 RepID=A0ABN6ZVG2_9CREN|nr:hypothetical protein PABY_19380 [Pyrodictium abyssi]
MPPGDLVKARNLGLREARYRWILIWDADFVADEKLVKTIREIIEVTDRKLYYLVYWPFIRFCGDIYHLCPNPMHVEHWLYTWSRKLKYVEIRNTESLIAPVHMYKVVYIREPLGYHFCDVRKPERLFFKHVWWKYKGIVDRLLQEDVEKAFEFAKKVAKDEYGASDLYEAGIKYMKTLIARLEPYDERKFGPLPQKVIEHYNKKILHKII